MPTGLDLPGLLGLIPEGGALVAPLFTSKSSAVFVVPHGTATVGMEHFIEIDGFTTADLFAVLQGPADDATLGGWLGAYLNYRLSPNRFFRSAWLRTIEAAGQELWEVFLGPVHERLKSFGLKEGAAILMMPQGGLGLLPLHAAWRIVEGKRRFVLDDWTVVYLPSGYALSVSRERLKEPKRQEQVLFPIINPTKDLAFTPAEGKAILALFAKALPALEEDAATVAAVERALGSGNYLHFSCHGSYNWQNPMHSGLSLADGRLTLAKIIAELDLSASRLVTLSACETGLTDIRQSPDEFLGLPAGFLQAGAPAVISTLWPVSDESTMLLMERFYQNLLGVREAKTQSPMLPALALREAQIWLRDVTAGELALRTDQIGETCKELPREQTRYSSPYHWAAFTFSGA
jgi:CHAT domain-containing protein